MDGMGMFAAAILCPVVYAALVELERLEVEKYHRQMRAEKACAQAGGLLHIGRTRGWNWEWYAVCKDLREVRL